MTKFFKNFFDLYHTSSYIGQINEKMEQIEKDILIKCREGDKEAFRQVVRQYQRMVFSLALKMLCDEEEAKDTVQDTFVRVWIITYILSGERLIPADFTITATSRQTNIWAYVVTAIVILLAIGSWVWKLIPFSGCRRQD